MKQIKHFFVIMFMLLGSMDVQAADDLITQQITIKLDEAGTLPDKIESTQKYKVTNLKVIGEINGTDLRLIRDMAGCDYQGKSTSGKLATLDLSEAKTVSGGDYHFIFNNVIKRFTYDDEISSSAFDGCSALTSLTLPSGVTKICEYAFKGCSGLASLSLPSSVTLIGWCAFEGCSGLASLPLPSSVTEIRWSAFSGCSGLATLAIPSSVTSIGNGAFEGCSGLTSIYVNWETPLKIDSDVFEKVDKQKCTLFVPQGTLQNYRLADVWGNFENIVEYNSTDSNKLTTIKLDEVGTLSDKIRDDEKYKITNLKIIGEINGTDWVLIRDMAGRSVTDEETPGKLSTLDLAEAKIVEGGERYQCLTNNDEIPRRAFLNCKGLDSLILPSKLKSIGYEAFKGCCNLTKLELPSSVTFISDWAFQDCSALNTLVLPAGIKSIENGTFYGCSALTNMVIPSGVTYIGQEAFENCSSLKKIELPLGLLSIQQYAFQNCCSLQRLTISSSVRFMGLKCLGGCVGLEAIYLCWEDKYAIASYDNSSNFSDMPYKKCVVYVPSELYDDYRNARWDIWFSMRPYDITSVGNVKTSTDAEEVSRYSVNGQRLSAPTKGLNIVKYSDGSVKKVAVQ